MKKWKLTLMMGLICGLLIAGNALAEYNADFMPYHYYTVGQGECSYATAGIVGRIRL